MENRALPLYVERALRRPIDDLSDFELEVCRLAYLIEWPKDRIFDLMGRFGSVEEVTAYRRGRPR